jgi:hypothetical protein
MKDSRTILRNVGWVLIVVGALDIGYMIYCLANQTSYSSSFNIFAVIAGIFLLRGSLKAARTISWFMAFFIACFTGVLVVMPFMCPVDFLVAYMRLAPTSAVIDVIFIIVIMALLIWIYRSLTSAPVLAAMGEAQIDHTSFWHKPTRGFWIGGCSTLCIGIFLCFLMGGATAGTAKQRAGAQVGAGYKFMVKSLNTSSGSSGSHIQAVVAAYNDKEIKDVVVEWSE